MKKIIVLSVIMLLLMGVNSFATDTRVLTMGENGTILMDDANIWLYPSRINHYPDILTAEMSSISFSSTKADVEGDQPISKVGINWKFGGDKPWILGTYLHNNAKHAIDGNLFELLFPSTSQGGVVYHGPYWEDAERSYSNKRVDLFWGTMFGENAFGIHLGYVHSSDKDEDTQDPGISLNERAYARYGFNLGLTMMENKLDLAAGIEFITYTYKNTYTTPDTGNYDFWKPEGIYNMFLRGRYFYEYSPTYTFVPHAEFNIGKFEESQNDWNATDETADTDYTNKYNLTAFELGVGMHYTPATKVLAIIDFGFMYSSVKWEQDNVINPDSSELDEQKWTYTMLPYFKIGLEAEVFSWMDLRLGATSYWTKYTNEDTDFDEETDKYTEKYPYNHTYMGLGFNWNRLHVDTYVDPELFMDGFYFLSGVDTKVAGMNFQISAKYDMF